VWCGLERDNVRYKADKSSRHEMETVIQCPPIEIGPMTEFFTGSEFYALLVSFNGEDYQTLGFKIRITVKQHSFVPEMTIPDDVRAESEPTMTSWPVTVVSQVQDSCSAFPVLPRTNLADSTAFWV